MTGTTTNGMQIPVHDKRAYTFVAAGAADNDKIATITYTLNGRTVGSRAFTYVGSTNNVSTDILTITPVTLI